MQNGREHPGEHRQLCQSRPGAAWDAWRGPRPGHAAQGGSMPRRGVRLGSARTISGMLVLASHSPRRRELLTNAGIAHVVRPANVPERVLPGESPREHVERLAREKAWAVAAGAEEIVLGADTIVVAGGLILGKPVDADDARRMLRLLSGGVHEVMTGVCLRRGTRAVSEVEVTRVRFVPLTEGDIEGYVASGEPMDKAGAYAIQGRAGKFIDRIEGCYFNVVGLPIALVWRLLSSFNV